MNNIDDLPLNTNYQVNQEAPKKRYFEKKEDNLYFVLERFNADNKRFWQKFVNKQSKKSGKFYNWSQDKKLNTIYAGVIGFKSVLICHQFSKTSPHDLWILFASKQLPEENSFPDIESLEMTCTVSTAPKAPFTTHMGIFRTINSNLKKQNIHPNISIQLHAFGAKIMKDLYPEKLYMITTPMPHMEAIFKKALGEENVYLALDEDWEPFIQKMKDKINLLSEEINDTPEKTNEVNRAKEAVDYYTNKITASSSHIITIGRNSSSFTLNDLNGKQIVSLDKNAMHTDYEWYFERETTFSGYNNLVAIPLQILADINRDNASNQI
jgi:hypothetical protein